MHTLHGWQQGHRSVATLVAGAVGVGFDQRAANVQGGAGVECFGCWQQPFPVFQRKLPGIVQLQRASRLAFHQQQPDEGGLSGADALRRIVVQRPQCALATRLPWAERLSNVGQHQVGRFFGPRQIGFSAHVKRIFGETIVAVGLGQRCQDARLLHICR